MFQPSYKGILRGAFFLITKEWEFGFLKTETLLVGT